MSSRSSKIERKDIIEVAVPPIEDENESRFLDDEGGFLSDEYARYAQEECGTAGAIGVALEILNDVESDLSTLADQDFSPDIVGYQASLIGEICDILTEAADQHISDYDSPIYDEEASDNYDEKESESGEKKENGSESSWASDDFIRVEIDGMNNKGNLLTRPDHLSHDHLHLSHGQKGQEVIAFQGDLPSEYSNQIQLPVLPFDTIEEAKENLSLKTTLQFDKGDLVKIPNPDIKDESTVIVDGFDVDQVQVEENIPRDHELTIKVRKIEDKTAYGRIKKKNKQSRKSRKKTTRRSRKSKKYTGSGKQRYAGKGNNRNPFQTKGGNMNSILRDNPR